MRQTPESVIKAVRSTAQLLDRRIPGWATGIPIEKVDIRNADTSPIAFVIGKDWAYQITAASAIEKFLLAPVATGTDSASIRMAAHIANLAWRDEIARRIQAAKAKLRAMEKTMENQSQGAAS